jgi:hypothetical protein
MWQVRPEEGRQGGPEEEGSDQEEEVSLDNC